MSFVDARRWRRTIFTDGIRFCLERPDGTACYWSYKRILWRKFSKRQRGGGGVMVWAGISFRAKTPRVFVKWTMYDVAYTNMLEPQWFLSLNKRYGFPVRWRPSPHRQAHHRELHERWNGSDGLGAALAAHELYRVLLGLLSHTLYDGGRQFDTVDDLREALIYE